MKKIKHLGFTLHFSYLMANNCKIGAVNCCYIIKINNKEKYILLFEVDRDRAECFKCVIVAKYPFHIQKHIT